MIKTDFHLHTTFSTDGISDMESMIRAAAGMGLHTVCFTEHNDFGAVFPEGPGAFIVDTRSYHEKYLELSEKYRDRIRVLFGVELGLQDTDEVFEHFAGYTKEFPFDFVIGSSHFAGGKDPYYPAYWESFQDTDAACRFYFEAELSCARRFTDYDAYGHLDYALRYRTDRSHVFEYERFADVLDELLKTIIEGGRVIEINSNGFRSGMNGPNPAVPIIRRYRELGGMPPTIGSDAHCTKDLARDFEPVAEILKECGYRSYSVFERRQRSELPL